MKQHKMILILALLLMSAGCGVDNGATNSSAVIVNEDGSASGAAASVVAGALNSSSSTTAQNFLDTNPICPTFQTVGAGCAATGGSLWLTYNACSFPASSATWSGTQALTMSAGIAACGIFPNPGASNTLLRQFVSAPLSAVPATASRISPYGTTVVLDDVTPNLGNFNHDVIASVANGGYGTTVTFGSGGSRSAVSVERRIYSSNRFDHSVLGSVSVGETSGTASRVVNGNITVYHNLLQLMGRSVFNEVKYTDDCCFPVSGMVITQFSAGANVPPTRLGKMWVGLSETLVFTGCGTGTLFGTDSSVSHVVMDNCL